MAVGAVAVAAAIAVDGKAEALPDRRTGQLLCRPLRCRSGMVGEPRRASIIASRWTAP
jgi:hypothetical protein